MTRGNDKSYSEMLKAELLQVARRLGLSRFSRLRKQELLNLILRATSQKKKGGAPAKGSPAGTPGGSSPTKTPANPGHSVADTPTSAPKNTAAQPKAAADPVKKAAPPRAAAAPVKKADPPRAAAAPVKKADPPPRQADPPARPATLTEAPAPAAADDPALAPEALQQVDRDLPPLEQNTGENRVVLLPRDPSWLFAYWELQEEYKEAARQAGGQLLALRLFDVTGKDFDGTNAHAMFEHECAEWARSWYLPVPTPDRDYAVEIGYRGGGEWFPLSRSNTVTVPADQPSTWDHTEFATVQWEESLRDVQQRMARERRAAGAGQVLLEEGELRIVAEAPPVLDPGAVARAEVFSGEAPRGPQLGIPGSMQPGSLGPMPSSAEFLAGSVGYQPGSLGYAPGSLGQLAGSVEYLAGSLGYQVAGVDPTGLPPGLAADPGAPLSGATAAGAAEGQGDQPPLLLQARVEMVIMGRSLPGTDLTVAGRTIPLGPDGGFSLRISVPEGTRQIPLVAVERGTGKRRTIQLQLGRDSEG